MRKSRRSPRLLKRLIKKKKNTTMRSTKMISNTLWKKPLTMRQKMRRIAMTTLHWMIFQRKLLKALMKNPRKMISRRNLRSLS